MHLRTGALIARLSLGGIASVVATGCAGGLPIAMDAGDRTELDAEALAERMTASDAVLVGELHDHPNGLSPIAEALSHLPTSAALSLEFLQRDAQNHADDFIAGRIDLATLESRTETTLPPAQRDLLTIAQQRGFALVASNAPRRYAKLARTEGYDALRALDPGEQSLFAIPVHMPDEATFQAFVAAMGGHPAETHPHASDSAHREAEDDPLLPFFRAQALWDATMADSIATALESGRRPVVHVVGRFHVVNDGGLPQMLGHRAPTARTTSIAMVTSNEDFEEHAADLWLVAEPLPQP